MVMVVQLKVMAKMMVVLVVFQEAARRRKGVGR